MARSQSMSHSTLHPIIVRPGYQLASMPGLLLLCLFALNGLKIFVQFYSLYTTLYMRMKQMRRYVATRMLHKLPANMKRQLRKFRAVPTVEMLRTTWEKTTNPYVCLELPLAYLTDVVLRFGF